MSKAKTYFVYLHRSPSDRVYIGLTNQHPVHKRWNRRDPYRHNQYFTSAIEKYGWENFQHEILCEGLTAEEAIQLEIDLISKYRSAEKEHGYNLTNGGGGRVGLKHTEKTKEKMSKAAKGKKKSEQHRANLSKANEIRFKDPEERKKVSNGRKGVKFTPEQCKKLSEARMGFKFSDEAKKNMSVAALQSWTIERKLKARKPVNQYDLQGNFIKTFTGIREAGATLGIKSGHISSCCKGERKTIGGYKWRYAND